MSKQVIKVMQILGDPTGGIRKHVHEIIRSSFEYEFEIYYIHGSTMDSVAKIDFDEFNRCGIKMISQNISKKPQLLDLLNIFKLVLFSKVNGINVIHGHGAKGGIYCRLVGLLTGLPSIYTPHGGSLHATYGKIEGFIYRTVERFLKPITRLYLFESNYTYNSFVNASGKLNNTKFIINYNGVDINSFSSVKHWTTRKDNIINLLVVGVLRKIKGQEVAIRALAKLIELGGLRFHLHFCGSGPDRDHLMSLAKLYGVFDNVSFHGDVADISHWYELCNLVIVPSYFESFGYVAIEAALMRRPVVASDCGGLSEIILHEKTGYLYPVGNADLLAKYIIYILENAVNSESVVNAAEARTKEIFNSKLMLNRIFSSYINVTY